MAARGARRPRGRQLGAATASGISPAGTCRAAPPRPRHSGSGPTGLGLRPPRPRAPSPPGGRPREAGRGGAGGRAGARPGSQQPGLQLPGPRPGPGSGQGFGPGPGVVRQPGRADNEAGAAYL